MSVFELKVSEKEVAEFIVNNLKDASLSQYFAKDNLSKFNYLVVDGKDIAAAEEFQKQTGAKIGICHLAALLAKTLTSSK